MSISLPTTPPAAATGARAVPVASVLRSSARCEWLLLRADPGWWLAIAATLACVGYALHNGSSRLGERGRAVAEAKADEAGRLSGLAGQLGRIARGEAPPPDAPYRDPANAIYVGRGQGATVAHLPDAPLAATAVGLSDLYPASFTVSAGSKDGFLFADEIANPTHLLTGSFDLAFVVVYLYPLLLLALSYDVLSGEREQGTLALTAASSAPLMAVLAGKLGVRAGGVMAAAVAGTWAYLLILGGGRAGSAPGLGALGWLTLAIAVYGLFWVALALAVNSLRRDSAYNAVALVMAWVVLLLVAPSAMNAAAQVIHPTPARAEMVLAVRGAAVDAERDRDATEARYREEHRDAHPRPPAPGRGGDATRRTLAVVLAADARADAVLADHEARVRAQRRLSDRLAYLVPPALVDDAVAELAGNGHTRWDDYLTRVAAFHDRWQGFFVERAGRGQPLTEADYRRFPRFEPSEDRAAWAGASARRVGAELGWVGAIAAGLLAVAARRLSGVA